MEKCYCVNLTLFMHNYFSFFICHFTLFSYQSVYLIVIDNVSGRNLWAGEKSFELAKKYVHYEVGTHINS